MPQRLHCEFARFERSPYLPNDHAHIRILQIMQPVVPSPYSRANSSTLRDTTEDPLLPYHDAEVGSFSEVPFFVRSHALAALPTNPMEIDEGGNVVSATRYTECISRAQVKLSITNVTLTPSIIMEDNTPLWWSIETGRARLL